jgi:hypothetical protein
VAQKNHEAVAVIRMAAQVATAPTSGGDNGAGPTKKPEKKATAWPRDLSAEVAEEKAAASAATRT